jgi:hypothetical protein
MKARDIIHSELSRESSRLLLAITMSDSFPRLHDWKELSHAEFFTHLFTNFYAEQAGLSRAEIKRAIEGLVEAGVLREERWVLDAKGEIQICYSFNPEEATLAQINSV